MITFAKGHAYGNDFLYVQSGDAAGVDLTRFAREICDRHHGVGADGLIVYDVTRDGASMRLFNADGSRAEVSGNGVRALAALLLRADHRPHAEVVVETEGGTKRLTLISRDGTKLTFRASMGEPADLRRQSIGVGAESVDLVVLNMGNPQAIILGPLPDDERFNRLGAALERHRLFPEGTNVEFAHVEGTDR